MSQLPSQVRSAFNSLTSSVLQQYLTMLGSTVLIPFLIVPAMGGTEDDKARVISTIFFISGLITLLQTVVGDRLPIIQVQSPKPRHRARIQPVSLTPSKDHCRWQAHSLFSQQDT